jgi:DNA-binding protein HU-beta
MRTKTELIDALAERTGHTKKDATAFIDALGSLAQESLAQGREVILPGLGKLTAKQRPARVGRNPQTGASIEIPARKVPGFTAAKTLKDAIADGGSESL